MKKFILILIGLLITISIFSQETTKRDIIIQKTTPMLHLNGTGAVINFYNNDVSLVQSTNQLDVNGGRLDANSGIKIGNTSATVDSIGKLDGKFVFYETNDTTGVYIPHEDRVVWPIDSAEVINTNEVAMYSNGDTTMQYIPHSKRIEATTIFPTIHSAAGDTSNYATPGKIGDIYIDTSNSKVYISKSAYRGGWLILNMLLPVFIIIKRRRRK